MQKAAFRIGPTHASFQCLIITAEGRSGYAAYRYRTVTKTLLVLKFIIFLLTAAFLNVSAKGVSQTVTLTGEKLPFKLLLETVETQTGYVFVADETLLEIAKPVTVKAKNQKLSDFLNFIFRDQPLKYRIANKNIIINSIAPDVGLNQRLSPVVDSPPITVRGRVVNEKGEPVVVSIILKGGTAGTTSDAHGYFVLRNIQQDAVLIISGVNIESREVNVNGRENLNIQIDTKIAAEEEVTINGGYYKTTQKLKVSNISKVNAKEIEKQPVSNPLATLQALVPGMEVTQQNGVPGGGFTVRIRGQNSIGNGNEPLYVIDGVPFTSTTLSSALTSGEILNQNSLGEGGASPLNFINPADINSIEILKDAASTSIYGSRGSNGVVLITTKRGQAGKNKVDLNFYSGMSKVPNFADLLNTDKYMIMRNEGKRNDNSAVSQSDYDLNGTWDTTRYTDWQKKLIGGTAKTTDGQISFSGGTKLTQFSVGGGYHKETTVFPGDNADQRISAHFSLTNTSANEKLKVITSINYSSGKTNLLSKDLTQEALNLSPVAPAVYDETGQLNWQNNTWENPFRYLVKQYSANTTNLIGNALLSYKILKGLEIKTGIGFTNTNMNAITTQPKKFLDPVTAGSQQHRSYFANTDFKNWIVEPQLSYSADIGKNHIELLAGASFFEQERSASTLTGIGFSTEVLMKNIGAASDIQGVDNYSQYRYASLLGRINYIYNEKYIIDITGRRDGSSRFGPGKQFANFAAIGTAWIFTNENSLKKLFSFLSYGKLRASFGTSGNDQLGDYEYLDTYTPVSYAGYMGSTGLSPVRLSNAQFAWETNKKFEVGIETSLLNNKLSAEISYYTNRSLNQLIGYSLPPTTGFNTIRANLPATIKNSGVEVSINSINIDKKLFSWKTALNLTIPRNKLVEFPNLEGSPMYSNTLIVGKPMNILRLYNYTGVNPETGLYTFEDYNKDGIYNLSDRYIVQFVGRNYYAGIQNNLQIRNFELSILFQYVSQKGTNFRGSATPGALGQQPFSVISRWRSKGDISTIQRYGVSDQAGNAYSNFGLSNGFVLNKSFMRLKNLSLAYSLNSAVTNRLGMQSVRVFVQGQNLLLFSAYKGLDPELSTGVLPSLRTITAGVHITL